MGGKVPLLSCETWPGVGEQFARAEHIRLARLSADQHRVDFADLGPIVPGQRVLGQIILHAQPAAGVALVETVAYPSVQICGRELNSGTSVVQG